MAEKRLNIRQQLALLPASIPDTVIDFLEGFTTDHFLKNEGVRSSIDAEYLTANEGSLDSSLKELVQGSGALQELNVEICTKEIPGAYVVRLGFEQKSKGLGLLIKMKEKTIFQMVFQKEEFNADELKKMLKNPT
ncbi:MAG: hypothetical protein M9962_12040 [Oligoflexia bacterium]|nr:hypothetical protein [Oligoflexia bacterium]